MWFSVPGMIVMDRIGLSTTAAQTIRKDTQAMGDGNLQYKANGFVPV